MGAQFMLLSYYLHRLQQLVEWDDLKSKLLDMCLLRMTSEAEEAVKESHQWNILIGSGSIKGM